MGTVKTSEVFDAYFDQRFLRLSRKNDAATMAINSTTSTRAFQKAKLQRETEKTATDNVLLDLGKVITAIANAIRAPQGNGTSAGKQQQQAENHAGQDKTWGIGSGGNRTPTQRKPKGRRNRKQKQSRAHQDVGKQ